MIERGNYVLPGPPVLCANPECPNVLPPNKGPGRARKWCSEKCRKTVYAGTCVSCGAPTVSDGSYTPKRCATCVEWSDEAILGAIRRWADEHGMPPRKDDWRVVGGPAGPWPSAEVVVRRIGWNKALLLAGFELRCDRRPETQAEIERLVLQGMPTSVIAERFGVTPVAIHARFRERGTTLTLFRDQARESVAA